MNGQLNLEFKELGSKTPFKDLSKEIGKRLLLSVACYNINDIINDDNNHNIESESVFNSII